MSGRDVGESQETPDLLTRFGPPEIRLSEDDLVAGAISAQQMLVALSAAQEAQRLAEHGLREELNAIVIEFVCRYLRPDLCAGQPGPWHGSRPQELAGAAEVLRAQLDDLETLSPLGEIKRADAADAWEACVAELVRRLVRPGRRIAIIERAGVRLILRNKDGVSEARLARGRA